MYYCKQGLFQCSFKTRNREPPCLILCLNELRQHWPLSLTIITCRSFRSSRFHFPEGCKPRVTGCLQVVAPTHQQILTHTAEQFSTFTSHYMVTFEQMNSVGWRQHEFQGLAHKQYHLFVSFVLYPLNACLHVFIEDYDTQAFLFYATCVGLFSVKFSLLFVCLFVNFLVIYFIWIWSGLD